jgi:Zn-dependent peptidase ImmA (M78 family)
VTYIRGFAVLHPFTEAIEAQPQHTVAHELGHVLADTSNEDKAEKKAMER